MTCPYCSSTHRAVRDAYYDQTCAGCVKRMFESGRIKLPQSLLANVLMSVLIGATSTLGWTLINFIYMTMGATFQLSTSLGVFIAACAGAYGMTMLKGNQ